MKIEFVSVNDLKRIKEIWACYDIPFNSSYFLSWGWIQNWIETLPRNVGLKLAVVLEGETPLLAFFIGASTLRRLWIIKSRAFLVNNTGLKQCDNALWTEYNCIPRLNKYDYSLVNVLKLLPPNWDEFILPAMDCDRFPANCLYSPEYAANKENEYKIIIEDDKPSYYVDLRRLRNNNLDYLSLLSANTRSQIRRSYKAYKLIGNVSITQADSVGLANSFLTELINLHRKRWSAKRVKSNFLSTYSETFHRKLINSRFNYGEIQLLKISCGNSDIGYLYNFVYKKRVLFYQSGFNYSNNSSALLKPGLICHSEAILHNGRLNHNDYDFLAGNEKYKHSLATNKRRIVWVKYQRPRIKFKMEKYLQKIINLLKIQNK